MPSTLALLIPAFAIAGIVTAFWMFKSPEVGFLALALVAPVSNHLSLGPVKLVYPIGVFVLAGTLYKHIRNRGWSFPKFVVAYGAVFLGSISYAWILGGFSVGRMYVGLVGSVLLVCAVFLAYRDTVQIRRWLWFFAISVATSNIITTVIVGAYPSLQSFIFDISSTGIRLQGTFGNPNMFGGAQIIAFSIFAFFVVRTDGKPRVLSATGLLVTFIAVLGSQSRSAILGLFLGVGIVGLLMFRSSRRPGVTGAVTLLAGVVMVFVFLNLPKEVAGFRLGRVGYSHEVGVHQIGIESISGQRLDIYEAAFETIIQNPFGIGYVTHEEYVKIISRSSDSGVQNMPHNFVLTHLLRDGVFGGCVMIIIWFLPVALISTKLWSGRLSFNSLSSLMLIGLVGYLIHNLLHSMTNWIYFWIFWGLCIRAAQLEDGGRRKS